MFCSLVSGSLLSLRVGQFLEIVPMTPHTPFSVNQAIKIPPPNPLLFVLSYSRIQSTCPNHPRARDSILSKAHCNHPCQPALSLTPPPLLLTTGKALAHSQPCAITSQCHLSSLDTQTYIISDNHSREHGKKQEGSRNRRLRAHIANPKHKPGEAN